MEVILTAQLVLAKLRVSRRLDKLSVDKCLSSIVMKVLITRQWEEFSLVLLNAVLGVASMSLIDY